MAVSLLRSDDICASRQLLSVCVSECVCLCVDTPGLCVRVAFVCGSSQLLLCQRVITKASEVSIGH